MWEMFGGTGWLFSFWGFVLLLALGVRFFSRRAVKKCPLCLRPAYRCALEASPHSSHANRAETNKALPPLP